ncbi:hypothetical protein BDB00DRAFT_372036 [Zychaea mexicana]|uniref:uncharacterized protein n=1 Tax=Zychaea mexicana TaxID=64656 RepID=UPI0022FDF87C|nr:uncharacterized protein BDB00DRAFT_372036 [Zychaea mexicana]KAI9493440.1 hypothetical protein BDB00DRAFT_372036 [Zychaea mexicana]
MYPIIELLYLFLFITLFFPSSFSFSFILLYTPCPQLPQYQSRRCRCEHISILYQRGQQLHNSRFLNIQQLYRDLGTQEERVVESVAPCFSQIKVTFVLMIMLAYYIEFHVHNQPRAFMT